MLKPITIKGPNDYEREVRAHVFGPLAAHRWPGDERDTLAWQITHLPTGYRVCHSLTFANATALAKRLRDDTDCPTPWDSANPAELAKNGDRYRALRAEIETPSRPALPRGERFVR